MQPSQKFFAPTAVLAVFGFILVLSVLYDSYKQTIINHKLQQQRTTLHNLQILTVSDHKSDGYSLDHIINSLQITSTEHDLFLIEIRDGESSYVDRNNLLNDNNFKKLVFETIKDGPEQGYIFSGDTITTWVILADAANQVRYTHIQKKENEMLSGFTRDFGVPIFITFLVVGWIMIWAGLILNSLFKRLNDQNILLEAQSQKIKDAHDVALNSSRAKTVFLANMSHEIRTPLTAIIGFSKSLLESEQTMQERIGAINTIHNSGKHLLHIVDEILDLSKIEAGSLEVELINVSPVILLNEICPLMRMQAESKGLEFSVNYEFPIPMSIKTDPTRLKQILLNLVSNAVKFTESGHIHVNVGCMLETNTMMFEIVDTGIGMTKLQQKRVFTAFAQADSSTTRRYGGTGLGLTLSKQFANKLGGTLSVDSEPGVGSKMRLKLNTGSLKYAKYYQSIADLPDETEMHDTPLRKVILSGNVLLAEDNPANQKLFELYLRATGVTTTIVENGAQAVDKALIKKYDLIFMDMQMPVMSGLDAVRELRKNNYKSPIIALTANSTIEDRDACFEAGYDDFISKPVDRSKFIEVLCKYLPESQPQNKDRSAIISSVLKDEPDLVDLVLDFLGKMPDIVQTIKNAFVSEEWDLFRSEIHKLKGVGSGYGYAVLTEIAGKIEFQLHNYNRAQIDILLSDLEQYVHRIIKGKPEIEALYQKNIAQG